MRPIMRRRLPAVKKNCPFCAEKSEPDYKEFDILKKYMTDRGKIMGKSRSALCQKHQRRVAVAIKRARHVALLPFLGSPR